MSLHEQLKQRRKALGLQQADLHLRAGMNQQQYQRIEAGGNPRLDTLNLLAQGLDAELLLVPKEKLAAVQAVLAGEATAAAGSTTAANKAGSAVPLAAAVRPMTTPTLADDPWAGLLGQHAR